MRRAFVVAALLTGCGVKAPPRPPEPKGAEAPLTPTLSPAAAGARETGLTPTLSPGGAGARENPPEQAQR